MAEEMETNNYMFDPYYGYTEQIPVEKNTYSIVGTGFLNHKMPFIRYKTDDFCSPENQYYSIEGKRSSTVGLYGINNEFLTSTAFDLENPVFKDITAYQFIQEEKGKADLLIIVSKNFKMSEMEIITNEINSVTKGIINIKIKIVDSLVLSPRGKYQMYISSIGKE
jgi:phenylacetate-coenzyme A ligase PaaK-like adenylate-forming protein